MQSLKCLPKSTLSIYRCASRAAHVFADSSLLQSYTLLHDLQLFEQPVSTFSSL